MQLLSLAKMIATRIETEAVRASVPVAMTVIDAEGRMVLQHRMAGAPVHAVSVSERKAYTSALVELPTSELGPAERVGEPDYAPTAVGGGRYCVIGGGVPLRDGRRVVGGVGVCGGTAEEDVAIVEAALSGFIRGPDPVRPSRSQLSERDAEAPRRVAEPAVAGVASFLNGSPS